MLERADCSDRSEGNVAYQLATEDSRDIALHVARLDRDMLFDQMARADRFAFREEGPGETMFIVRLALEHGLKTADATYLALAMTARLALATNDKKIIAAARKERIPVITTLK